MSLDTVHEQLKFVIDDAVLAQIAKEAAEERAEQHRVAGLSPYYSDIQCRAVLKDEIAADRERFAGVIGATTPRSWPMTIWRGCARPACAARR